MQEEDDQPRRSHAALDIYVAPEWVESTLSAMRVLLAEKDVNSSSLEQKLHLKTVRVDYR